ncbi:phage tail tape measure protein [Eisenbergiella porci]|uniref:phage tail tape measure protein n=1 Tax=Eisenbergiella porci TaxID=2652274 RepID=UPI002A813E92|nr:phage tail tape measure protein [Eisenbergiella porci]
MSRYNSISSQPASFQKKYNDALQNGTSSLTQYISSLKGANASIGGYIKYLINAKISTVALETATTAMKMALSAGISIAISLLVSQINTWIHAQEEARKKAIDITNSYEEQQSSIDSYIKKYKELKTILDTGNLTIDETRSVKEQLLEIQNALINSYGDEVSNIDLVNGKYQEQIDLLNNLSKEKAIEYTVKNRDMYEKAKHELSKTRTYDIGQVFTWDNYSPLSEDDIKLKEFISNYNNVLNLVQGVSATGQGISFSSLNLEVNADVETADRVLQEFSEDLRKFGEENGIDVTIIISKIASQLRELWTDELIDYKSVYDKFIIAEVVRNDTLRPLYHNSIQAVEDYNTALSSGEGVSEAKANLNSVKESAYNATDGLEGSAEVFDDIFNKINKTKEIAYNVGESLKKNTIVQQFAEQLRGLSDIDLKSINFTDDYLAPGEEAFNSLINTLGLSQDESQILIDKLTELGYIQDSLPDVNPVSTISQSILQISEQLSPQFEELSKAYNKIFTPEGFTLKNVNNDLLDELLKSFSDIEENLGIDFDSSKLEDFLAILSNGKSTSTQVQEAFNELATSYLYSTDVMEQLNDSTAASVEKQLEAMGVTNASVLVADALNMKEQELIASKQYLAKGSEKFSDATLSDIATLGAEQVAAHNCSQSLALYYLKKALANKVVINNDEDIKNLLILAEAAGITTSSLAKLQNAKALYNEAIESGNDADIQRAEQRLIRASDEVNEEINKLRQSVNMGTNQTSQNTGTSSTASTPKETTDPHVTDFDEKYDKLKDLRDRDILNEKQYLDALRALNEKYYKNDKKYTDQYEKYKKEYLDGMLSLHDSVISIATKQIDKYISSLEDQKGAAVDSLKEQQDAAKEALEAQKDALEEQIKLIDKQIDAKQAEIDAINEENEAHENTINLEKEQYELERLRNQRTEFTYSGKEKGFVYRTDTGAIRDQEQNVKEAEDKIRIAGIEKEISLLEKQKDALKDQQDAIDEQIDKVDEYYGKIIEDTETYWDGMIQGAENAKSEWEKMGDAIEEAEDKVKLASVGIDPNDPNALLSEETIRNFKEMHDSLMADVYAGNSEMLNALSELENVNLSSLTGYLSDTQEFMEILAEGVDFENLNNSLGSVMDQFSKVAEAAGIMTGSVVGTTGVSVGKNNGTNASPSQGSGNGNISFIDAVAGLEKESVPMLNNVADAFAGSEDSEDSTQSIAGSVEAAKAAIAGSSSGKKSSAEGENSSGEDSGSLMEAMAAQSQAALDEETGIPAQIQKWQELNGVLSGILENLRNIAAIIPLLNPQDDNFSVTSGTTGITQANGGLSHGDKNAMVSEYGQLETIIRRNGTYQITSSPTLTDLNPGDIVLNNSKTLALIRSKRRAASSGVKNLSLASPVLFSSALPELQPRNSVLAQSNAAASAPTFADNHQDNKIDVTIGDIILENVRDTDTLSRQIVMRLPTQIKQELSKRG